MKGLILRGWISSYWFSFPRIRLNFCRGTIGALAITAKLNFVREIKSCLSPNVRPNNRPNNIKLPPVPGIYFANFSISDFQVRCRYEREKHNGGASVHWLRGLFYRFRVAEWTVTKRGAVACVQKSFHAGAFSLLFAGSNYGEPENCWSLVSLRRGWILCLTRGWK